MQITGKTLIQSAHVAKQVAFFIRLFVGANYDLDCNSVFSPRCFVHLFRKSSELQQEGYLPKTILLPWLFGALWSYLSPRDKISSILFVIYSW